MVNMWASSVLLCVLFLSCAGKFVEGQEVCEEKERCVCNCNCGGCEVEELKEKIAELEKGCKPKPEKIEVCDDEPMDLVFVLDSSGSIEDNNPPDGSYDNWNLTLTFVANVVDRMTISPKNTRVGLVRFANNGKNIFFMNTYKKKEKLIKAITELNFEGGNTNTSGGLRRMHKEQFTAKHGDRPEVPNVAIVLTDGESTWDKHLTIFEAEEARRKDVRIFVIGISKLINEQELRSMSSMPQAENVTYWKSPDFLALDTIIDDLVHQTCWTEYEDEFVEVPTEP